MPVTDVQLPAVMRLARQIHEPMFERLKKLNALFGRRDRIWFGFILLIMLGNAGLETLGVGLIPVFVGAAVRPETVTAHPFVGPMLQRLGITTPRALLVWGSITLIFVFLVKTLYAFMAAYARLRFVQVRRVQLMQRLFSLYMKAPYEFHLTRNTAELLRNVKTEIRNCTAVVERLVQFLMKGLMTGGIVALLFVVQPVISLVALPLFAAAGGGFLLVTRKKSTEYGERAREERKAVIKAINQGLGALKEVRILGRESCLVGTLGRSIWPLVLAQRYRTLAGFAPMPFLEFLAVAGLLGIAIALLVQGRGPESIAPILALFAAAFIRLKASVAGMISMVSGFFYDLASVEPVYDDVKRLEKLTGREDGDGADRRLHLRESLQAKGVWYRYPGTESFALCGVDLEIEKGSSVAFVGPTGAGKTTVVDVLLGLLRPERGSVKVDGVNIQTNLRGWQDNIGYIPQEIYLTDDTIRHNVALGLQSEHVNDENLWQALHAAQLVEFIEALPDGVETIVGERGLRISGGQKQRIGIARALYHNPDVLVMDEPTSSLDMTTERRVVTAINALKGERTVILIAHRIATVRKCDRLFFVKDGHLDASGSYKELLEAHPEFRAMATS